MIIVHEELINDVVAGWALSGSIDEIVISVGWEGIVVSNCGRRNSDLDSRIWDFEVYGALVDIVWRILNRTSHDGIFTRLEKISTIESTTIIASLAQNSCG